MLLAESSWPEVEDYLTRSRAVIRAAAAVLAIKQARLELGCAEHKLQLALGIGTA